MNIRAIVDLELIKVKKQLAQKAVTIEVSMAAKDWLGDKGYDQVFGARPLRRVIQDNIEDKLSEMLLSGEFSTGDHILIDEAQDCTDEERDLLRAVYGHRRIAIADGMEQLVRRQTPCDWLRGLPRTEVAQRVLGDSLRMQRNIAEFVNAFARAAGFCDWTVNPREDMPGGRIIVALGADSPTADLVRAMGTAAKAGHADPIDCLICVPHTNIVRDDAGLRRAVFADRVKEAGGVSWDASDFRTRMIPPATPQEWRIMQYDSCRGLEGWITAALDLDQFYAQKLRYPNFHRDDFGDDAEAVAKRSLLIPLTRAVHMLIVTVRDENSPVVTLLREAAGTMPSGVVEWCSAQHTAIRVLES